MTTLWISEVPVGKQLTSEKKRRKKKEKEEEDEEQKSSFRPSPS
jgi:hypothetical protein